MNLDVILKALPEIVTQLLAFLLVFLILKKFAFGAIFASIEARQKTIADSIRQAQEKKAEMERLEKEYRARLQNIEQEARTKVQEALTDAGRIAQEIKDQARRDSLAQLERAKQDIEQEVAKSRLVLRTRVVEIAGRMAEKIIRKNISVKGDEAFNEDILKEVEDDILKAGRA